MFSSDQEDGEVLEDLRKLANCYLQQIFNLQHELANYKSLENAPTNISKVLKRNIKKTKKLNLGTSLEEQVFELQEKVRLQEKELKNKEKKVG